VKRLHEDGDVWQGCTTMLSGSVARILGTDDDNAGRQQRTGHVTLQCHLEPAVEGAATLSVSML
jgi:hypothetical protein